MTTVDTEVVENCHSFSADRLVFFPPSGSRGFVRIMPESDKNCVSFVGEFQADCRGFSPIEGGPDSGGSAS
jgi:hypothetical protein